ncbi:MAG: hypothetical protein V3U06_09960 [Candidatus Binatia bacterium]
MKWAREPLVHFLVLGVPLFKDKQQAGGKYEYLNSNYETNSNDRNIND